MEEKKNKKKAKYTVLLVPNNAGHVKQFHIYFDTIIAFMVIFTALIVGLVFYVTSNVTTMQELEERVSASESEKAAIGDENILLKAEIESLEASVHEAMVTIEASKNLQIKEAEKQSEQTKPTSFPVDNASAIPDTYSDEKQYLEFTTGYGTKVLATGDGVVSEVSTEPELGFNKVVIDHGNGYTSIYMIPSTPIVSEKDKVVRGSKLFVVDSDDQTLAYQIQFNGVSIDPMSIMEING